MGMIGQLYLLAGFFIAHPLGHQAHSLILDFADVVEFSAFPMGLTNP
jgi:hypothetical protein